MTVDPQGIARCAKYAFAPNWFHYCGPDRQRDLLGYVSRNVSDAGLTDILHRFETLYPYLLLIASENNIKDPFDRRVVEAYWLGNRLLGNVGKKAFADHLTYSLQLKRKVARKDFTPMMDHAVGGVPNHTFHVLTIFIRTGRQAAPHTISTMNECRISWGKVVGIANRNPPAGGQIANLQLENQCIVETQPLVYQNGKLKLGQAEKKLVTSIGVTPKKGDWVSIHWGYVCDILDERQRKLLAYYTRLAIAHANYRI